MQHKTVDTLLRLHCSLVLEKDGSTLVYTKPGVRDLEDLLKHHPDLLRGSCIADKVVGKAAAALMAVGGVSELYAHVLSAKALDILRDSGIVYTYGTLVDAIIMADGDSRCPLETIVEKASMAEEVVEKLFKHFDDMNQTKRNL